MTGPIVIAGATGRVGGAAAQRLLAAGHAVRVVGRNPEALKPFAARGAEICSGTLKDRAFLTNAFRGAKAVYVLTAVDVHANNVNEDQYEKADAIAAAIKDAGVEYVVVNSSWGTELTSNSGGILGSRRIELLLSEMNGLNVVFLRPVWFMENFLWSIGLIKMSGVNGLAFRPDVAFPMISAADDISPVVAEYLASLNFKGRNVRYLCGPREYTMTEVTRILGAAIAKPELRYIDFPDAVFRKGLIGSGGLTLDAADMAIQISRGIESKHIHAEPRSPANTTPTTLEEFAKTKFAPAFQAAPKATFGERFGGVFLRSYLFATGHRAV